MTNSVDHDLAAPSGEDWSESSLFGVFAQASLSKKKLRMVSKQYLP